MWNQKVDMAEIKLIPMLYLTLFNDQVFI